MKSLPLVPAFLVAATPVFAETNYTNLFSENNPDMLVQLLSDQPPQSPSDIYALGAAHFLRAIEGAYQTRYKYDVGNLVSRSGLDIPFLSVPIAPNPNAVPFDPAVLNQFFETALDDLALSNTYLDQLNDDDTVSVSIDLTDLWLDINSNGIKDDGEEFYKVLSVALGLTGTDLNTTNIVTTFDVADAAWLSAYSHMLSGMSELALSTDPSAAVTSALNEIDHVNTFRGPDDAPLPLLGGWQSVSQDHDILVASILAAFGDLDPENTQMAHQHFLDGIEDNKVFWNRLEAETDNENEFIPNDQQTSALPLEFPRGVGQIWQNVLADVEAVLEGRLLLPHWRLGQSAGINFAAILDDPSHLDIVRLFLGHKVRPYAESGRLIDFAAMREFEQMTQGNSPLFAIILN